jgi:hypothetical protein
MRKDVEIAFVTAGTASCWFLQSCCTYFVFLVVFLPPRCDMYSEPGECISAFLKTLSIRVDEGALQLCS